MAVCISITLFRDVFLLEPHSGIPGKALFQEEDAPTLYCNLSDGPEHLGRQIREAEHYSRNFADLNLKYPKGIIAMLSKKRREHHSKVSEMTGIKLNQLHKFDHSMSLEYETGEIILRFFKRAEDEKFSYRFINRNKADEPRLPDSCSDLELGERIFDWVATLNEANLPS
jgi:hypothetical protein